MPNIRTLPNKPLAEAIFELRWQVDKEQGDPRYGLFLGRLHDRVREQYPVHEPLPANMLPSPIAEGVIQQRFRTAEGQWPLVQVGPGVVTLNSADDYDWDDFGKRAKSLVRTVYEAYPDVALFKVQRLTLRYLNAFRPEDVLESGDHLEFLRKYLKCDISFPAELFEGVAVAPQAKSFQLKADFDVTDPPATIGIHFGSGTNKNAPAIIMETVVQSETDQAPKMPAGFDAWIDAVHRLTDDWFFKLIEGELDRRFAGD